MSRTLQLRAPEATTAVLALLVSYGAFSSDEAATKEMTSRYVAQGPAATANSMLLATTEASTEAKQPNWSVSVANRLRRLRQLEAGWDGPGSVQVDAAVIEKAWRLLTTIATEKTRAPSISPGRDGSLQLAWYTRDLELEIDLREVGDPDVWLYDRSSGEELDVSLASPDFSAAIKQLSVG